MVKTILICGGAGFIGSHFAKLFLTEHPGACIVIYDVLTYAGNADNLVGLDHIFVNGDITDAEALERAVIEYQPETVVNFAAESHVDRSIHGGADAFIHTNIIGVQRLLEALKKHPEIKRFLQVSTDEVYGDTILDSKTTFNESALLRPSSPYSASKAAGDLLCLAYHRTFNLPVIVTRGSNTYGPHHYPEKVIPFFILKMIDNRKMPVYGTGANIRDWMYVSDHCRGILSVLERGKFGEIYNISADEYHSNLEVARMIAAEFGKGDEAIEFVTDRPGHDLRYAPDASKIKAELGWRPKMNFKIGLTQTIEWFKNNRHWVEGVQSRSGKINPHL